MTDLAKFYDKWLPRLAPALTAAFTFALFLPSLHSGFLNWDDAATLLQNPHYRGLGGEQLKWMFTTGYGGPYQPLSWLTLGADYLLWGMRPFGYHLTNIVLHSLNTLAFYFLSLKLLALAAGKERAGDGQLCLAAAFAALFFGVHPLRVESVSWVTERRDVLSGLFYLAAVLWYITPRCAGAGNAPPWRRHLLPLAAFLLSLLSKSMAISLPAVLIALDIYPLKRLPGAAGQWWSAENRSVWLEKIPYFILAAAFAAAAYFFQARAGAMASGPEFGWAARAAQSLFAGYFYVEKTLLPAGLSPLYELPGGFSLLSRTALWSGAALAALTAAAVLFRRRWPALPTAWFCYLATLSPVSGLVKIGPQAAADRYTYLPCLGFAMLAGAVLLRGLNGARSLRSAAMAAALAVITVLSILTWRQQAVWRDSESLWRRALAADPKIAIAHSNLGSALAEKGGLEEAALHYREALRLNPRVPNANSNLAAVFLARGNFDAAALHAGEELKINPSSHEAHHNLAVALTARGETAEADAHYREALRLNPDYALARYHYGVFLAGQGKPEAAAEQYGQALRCDPDFAEAHINLGSLLAARNLFAAAGAHYREALRVSPGNALAHNNLGIVLTSAGDLDGAIFHFREALRLAPGYADARTNLEIASGLRKRKAAGR
ncbi:MAG TPA: tetratricopeptide repeat protein [Elusimicrobiales bacterium]|nr:tetratricopeptide repeat protein [Elusimicrobiales bacterium]